MVAATGFEPLLLLEGLSHNKKHETCAKSNYQSALPVSYILLLQEFHNCQIDTANI